MPLAMNPVIFQRKVGVTSPEVYGDDFDKEDFISLSTSETVTGQLGMAKQIDALVPTFQYYDKANIRFGEVMGAATSATLTLYGIDAQDEPFILGQAKMGTNGQFADHIEFETIYARYFVAVSEIAGGDLTVSCLVQGVHREPR